MCRAIASLLFFLIFSSYSRAAFTDFQELSIGTEFAAGETFVSQDLMFEVVDFNGPGPLVRISPFRQSSNPDEKVLVFGEDVGVNIELPVGTQQMLMFFAATSNSNSGIVVNGVASQLSAGFRDLDSSVIGGVSISVVLDEKDAFGETGTLFLNGPINSFTIGGTEMAIDNVSVIIPEPTSAALLFAASISLLATRRRRCDVRLRQKDVKPLQ